MEKTYSINQATHCVSQDAKTHCGSGAYALIGAYTHLTYSADCGLTVWEIWLTLNAPQESVVAKVGHSMTHGEQGSPILI
jgi:hypothetical protein